MDSSLYSTFWFIYPNNHGFSVDHGWIPSESPSNIHLLPNRATNNSSLGIQGGSFRWNLHMIPKPAVSESAPKKWKHWNICLPKFRPCDSCAAQLTAQLVSVLVAKIFRRPFDLIQKMNLMKPFKFWTIS